MTAAEANPAPRAKEPAPPLSARADRPPVVRLRKSVVTAAVMGAAGLLAGSLAWAFILGPEHRAGAQGGRSDVDHPEPRGAVRPSERVTSQPGSYAQLDELPEPRRLGFGRAGPIEPAAPPPGHAVARSAPGHGDAADEARRSGLFFQAASAAKVAEATAAGTTRQPADVADAYNPHGLLAPLSPFEVKAGTIIPAALLTAVDTARAGPVVASVSESIFDTVSGRTLLVPQGSRLIGRHEGESRHGDKRAFLEWDRLILPNGKSLILTKEPGVDAQGATGVEGQVDRRILPLAIATLFAGAITTIGQAARDHDDHSGGLLGDAGDAAAISAAQTGGKLIDRELEVRPSIRLNPGAQVRVLITRDLVLEPYRP
jgi:type IV secretion system protein VirB10